MNDSSIQQGGFYDLGLSEPLLQALQESGYQEPTPIQTKAIPAILMQRDILGCAQTGTGKTASFTLPMLDILAGGRAKARMPRSVIITPTRELAAQIADNFERYGKYQNLTMALLIGGVAFGEQDAKLNRGVDVLIATPGRLLDHISRGKVLLGDVQIFIIDEADRMLDMGFIPDVERILGMVPPQRQTLMFSATMPPEIRKLAEKFLNSPREITVAPPATPVDRITQSLVHLQDSRKKRGALDAILDDSDIDNALIFCNRKRETANLATALSKQGVAAGALHGDMDQYRRLACLEDFKAGRVRILVCSDVAARGLDIPSVSHVINYDVPTHPEDYVHRIGRTGRAGRTGTAITFATPLDDKFIGAIEELTGRSIPVSKTGPVSKAGATHPERKKPQEKQPKSERPARRATKETADLIASENTPFGNTDQVPNFLRK